MTLTYAAFLSTVQGLLNDSSGEVWTATKVLPFATVANRQVQREFATRNIPTNKIRSSAITITSGTTSIATTTLTDMIAPYQIWEKTSGMTDATYLLMDAVDDLPWRDQTNNLTQWVWEGGVIKFVGATEDKQIVVSYECELSDITTGGSFTIPNSPDSVAFYTAAMCARTKGDRAMASDYDAQARDIIDKTANQSVRAQQFNIRRRKAYGSIR